MMVWLARFYKGMLLVGLKRNETFIPEISLYRHRSGYYFSLPCVKGGGTACRDGGIANTSLKQPLSQLR